MLFGCWKEQEWDRIRSGECFVFVRWVWVLCCVVAGAVVIVLEATRQKQETDGGQDVALVLPAFFSSHPEPERRERERNQTAAARTSMSDYGTELLRRQLAGEHFAGEVWSGPPAPAISQQHKGPGPGPGTLPQPGPFVIACRQYADICPIIMARLIHRPFHFLFSLSIMPPQNSTRTRSIWCRWG